MRCSSNWLGDLTALGSHPVALTKPDGCADSCEVTIALPLHTRTRLVALTSTARTVELYAGAAYIATVRGSGDETTSTCEVPVPSEVCCAPLVGSWLPCALKCAVH
jgi:hypothetical protein